MGNNSLLNKSIASGKLTHMEKYGFAYPEDLQLVQDVLDGVRVSYTADRSKANVEHPGGSFTVTVRNDSGGKQPQGKGGWIVAG